MLCIRRIHNLSVNAVLRPITMGEGNPWLVQVARG